MLTRYSCGQSPTKCVPHPEQNASHICHRFWAQKAFYFCYDALFGPESYIYGQKGEDEKVHGWDCWKYLSKGRYTTVPISTLTVAFYWQSGPSCKLWDCFGTRRQKKLPSVEAVEIDRGFFNLLCNRSAVDLNRGWFQPQHESILCYRVLLAIGPSKLFFMRWLSYVLLISIIQS